MSREPGEPDVEVLHGGMDNAGAVVRRGDTVERPAPPHAAALHAHLRALAAQGFDGAPTPLGTFDGGRRERLGHIEGEVAVPPFPAWTWSDDGVLRSVGALLRRLHRASAALPVDRGVPWRTGLADPEADTAPADSLILCHNDVCPENVVFRDRVATAFIDFDQAAPGRPLWDVAMVARYWVPMSGEGPRTIDRLRVLADGYGLDAGGRAALPRTIEQAAAVARAFSARRVRDGDPVYVRALAARGGWESWDRHQAWLAAHRRTFADGLLDSRNHSRSGSRTDSRAGSPTPRSGTGSRTDGLPDGLTDSRQNSRRGPGR
ncbi:phosphotransferase enzyme family protein [Streptomyces salyersiae]|uniref:Phosphotransferase n=1 Tax=Streptomyces salyersiae TaxID=3075530 RepID=A0ABU2RJ76_9ACTN|nr:phosphotransferase [Streptomyces sp. DSM 41770]MDT0428552.1 phosphotransferase [Streptomyces sp. DSM 41770]